MEGAGSGREVGCPGGMTVVPPYRKRLDGPAKIEKDTFYNMTLPFLTLCAGSSFLDA